MRGSSVEWDLSDHSRTLQQIEHKASSLGLAQASDSFIQERSKSLVEAARNGATTQSLLVESYALVREASHRAIGMRHFDVQMLAGIAMHRETFIEMQTGEGKTLAAVLPAYLGALSGRGVHVLTFNDYLARRDAEWMKTVYQFLGLSVAHVVQGMDMDGRRKAYKADVTYLTAREAGYDFLRQSLARSKDDSVMRPFHMAIVDEADSILIDEARVPLVLAGSDDQDVDGDRLEFASLVNDLQRNEDYSTDENARNVFLTESGSKRVRRLLGIDDLMASQNREVLTKVNQALHAATLISKDVDYIVRDGQVKIVDEFTGRIVNDRHWPDGLHRAVEAKEHLLIRSQGIILNSITMQHLVGLYPRLCGMTGTVQPSEEELKRFYGKTTTVIPPNKICVRVDHRDDIFTNKAAKYAAIIREVKQSHVNGRPVLIGTSSIEESQSLELALKKAGILCNVLNAKNDEEEAAIIQEAGALNAVTVSTNMAGRGTDIRLGGGDEEGLEQVIKCGGLCVIGTSRFESSRVDDQLRGRAGRQGDPGSSKFILSLEDDLLVRFGIGEWLPESLRPQDRAEPIDIRMVYRKVGLVQRIVEGQNFDIRKTLWNYTSFVEKQRRKWHEKRYEVLLGNSTQKLESLCPEKFEQAQGKCESGLLAEVEIQITLCLMDRVWSNHLANIADVREGIHLRRLGGQDPLHEFYIVAQDMYSEMEKQLDEDIKNTFAAVAINEDGIDLDKEGLRGPSSTWTYLVNDNPFEWLGSLSEMGNVGLGIAAGLYFGPVFAAQALYRKFFAKK
jgi:preprotein translocase subunit SecA